MQPEMTPDVWAGIDLARRAGAIACSLETNTETGEWRMIAQYGQGSFLGEGDTPGTAALDLVTQLLGRGMCKCGSPSSIADPTPEGHCAWSLTKDGWTPSCAAAGLVMDGENRGNVAAMQEAYIRTMAARQN